ncbi:RNA-directed DNA polymerase, eukaryota, reverse transcriptase zinc-binding domain protein, partial [Tanacetum coccineum]
MRTKRNTRIPLKFDDSVHSISNTKTKNKKTASKNNGCTTVDKTVESDDNKDEGEGFMSWNFEKGECSMEKENCGGDVVNDNSNEDSVEKGDSGKKEVNAGRKSFVEVISGSLSANDRSLECIPTKINDNEVKVVVFDDIMAVEGSKSNGVFFMKFRHEEGLNQVVNSGPWMVKRKPLVVQKWSVDLKLESTELDKIPLWVRLCNIPIEAWTVKSISAIAIRVGSSLVMDVVTASECKKNVKVAYDWKPPACNDCGVFGHANNCCPTMEPIKVTSGSNEKNNVGVQREDPVVNTQEKANDAFEEVSNRKKFGIDNKIKRQNFKAYPQNNKHGNSVKSAYQAKRNEQVKSVKTPVKSQDKVEEKNGSNDSANKGGWKRISEKRMKNQAKTDKTEHGMKKRGKSKVKSKPKSSQSQKVNQVKVKV